MVEEAAAAKAVDGADTDARATYRALRISMVALVLHVLTERTRFGRLLFATGGNDRVGHGLAVGIDHNAGHHRLRIGAIPACRKQTQNNNQSSHWNLLSSALTFQSFWITR